MIAGQDPRLPANPQANETYLRLLNLRLNELFKDIYKTMAGFSSEVTLKDTAQLDSFSRLRVSNSFTLFDAQQEYGLNTLNTWDAVVYDSSGGTATYSATTPSSNGSVSDAAGNAVGPTNSDSRMTPITVSADNGDYSILQSRQYVRYIPGKSQLIFVTGVFAPTTGASAYITLRSTGSGSTSDSRKIPQADWNIDKMNGRGASGVNLDFTKTQILVIDAQWLGVGRVRVGFDVGGKVCYAHEFMNANVLAIPYTQSFNLPVRLEAQNVAGEIVSRVGYFDKYNGVFLETSVAASGGTINFVCCSVQSEGGQDVRGFPRSASNGITTIGVTTRRPVLSIRPKATFNSRTNRGHIELSDFALSASSNSSYYEIVAGGTLTGASWTSVGSDSIAEYDVASTAISGGIVIANDFVLSGSGATRGSTSGALDARSPLVLSQIDALTATQIPISIVCTSFTGTSNITSALNWHEQVI